MTEPPDLEEIARRYLELWQRQLTGMAGDPQFAEAAARAMELAYENARLFADAARMGPFAAWGGPAQDADRDAQDEEKTTRRGGTPSDAGTGAPGAAAHRGSSGDAERNVDELTRRVAALEERLAALEAGAGGGGGGAARRRRGKRR
jgi:hypothetical protein